MYRHRSNGNSLNHACSTVQGRGWGGIKNGDLLHLAGKRIAILELSTNDIARIQAASALIEDALKKIQPDEFRQLTIP